MYFLDFRFFQRSHELEIVRIEA